MTSIHPLWLPIEKPVLISLQIEQRDLEIRTSRLPDFSDSVTLFIFTVGAGIEASRLSATDHTDYSNYFTV